MLIDTHAHVIKEFYSEDDIKNIVDLANKNNVIAILNNGLNVETNREVLALSKKYPIFKSVLGFYPIDALKDFKHIDSEIEFIRKNKDHIIAIGEVGLDYLNSTDREKQKEIFWKFLELSLELDKPIIIHSRKAEKEVIEMCEKSKNQKIVMHTFSGNFKLVKRIEDNGWFFSVPTAINYSSHFQELVKRVSINQIFTETDSPFMHPLKEKNNIPSNVSYSIKKIAELKKMDIIEVKKNIFMNYQKIFL